MSEARLLDELMADAWPARVTEIRDGWRFRWTDGITRRANSALAGPAENLASVLDAAEAFYRGREAPAVFSVSTAIPIPGLDNALRARWYVPTARTLIMTATSEEVLARSRRRSWDLTTDDRLSEEWLAAFWRASEGDHEDVKSLEAYREVLLAPARETFFTIAAGSSPGAGAVGQVVIDRGWGGLQCIATDRVTRRRGAALAVVNELARVALAGDAPRLYLGVMAENPGATALYAGSGFAVSHEYCYFIKAPGS